MPWVYGDEGIALMKKYFTLRTQLIPTSTPTLGAHRERCRCCDRCTLSTRSWRRRTSTRTSTFSADEMLIAPVFDPSGNQTVYLPPGDWLDFFTGKRYRATPASPPTTRWTRRRCSCATAR